MKDFGCADCVHVYKSEASNCNCWCHKQRRENTQPWSNLCLCLQEQYLAAFCNTDERYLFFYNIFCQSDESCLPISWSISSCIASIHETGSMNNALNGEGKKIFYTLTQRNDVICNQGLLERQRGVKIRHATVREWYSQVTNLAY
jgi:hypothetical protein